MEIPTSVRQHQCKWCTHVSWHRISFKALFVLSLFLCVGTATVSAECGCHKALGSMRFRMLHLISSISPVSRGARQQPRESQHPVEQSWLTWCLPEGACTHSLTGIVCKHVKQWETSQPTDTLSCSHFEWQQCMREGAAAPVWDSAQTAFQADWRLYHSYQLGLLRSRCCHFIALLEYCCVIIVYIVTIFCLSVEGPAACICDSDLFSFIARVISKAQWSLCLPPVYFVAWG